MKIAYWSCSKFADCVRGTSKLEAGTVEEWQAWEKLAKTKPFRFWLAESGLDFLQDVLFWPANCVRARVTYANNRWITKSHSLTSKLKRGQWHDFDVRLLHAAFDELVHFVEVEQAWMEVVFSKENQKKYGVPLYRKLFRIGLWRCPEAGFAYLQWAAELKRDEEWLDKDSPDFGKPTPQALAAQETHLLYMWWKVERPKRPDPYEASGWTQYCEKKRKKDELNIADKSGPSKKILKLCQKIEMEQDEEDTAMLIRLIKIRHSLWT